MTRYQEFREYPISNSRQADTDDFGHWSSAEATTDQRSLQPYLQAEEFDPLTD